VRKGLFSTTAIAGLAAALAGAPAPASATLQKIAATVTPAPATNSGGVDWTNFPVDISTFDQTTGHLKSVMVVQNLTANYSGLAVASSPTTVSLTVTTKLRIVGGPSVLDGNPALTITGGIPLLVGTTAEPFTISGVTTGNVTASDPASSDWESSGPGTTEIDLYSSETLPAIKGVGIDISPALSFSLGVTYSFTTSGIVKTPEPASALMVGAGVIALGAVRRRRRR
jgi:hypothetical protein